MKGGWNGWHGDAVVGGRVGMGVRPGTGAVAEGGWPRWGWAWVGLALMLAGRVHGVVPTVGMEGRLEVVLPVAGIEGRPVTERAKVLVRVAERYPHGTATRYDLRYVGLVPGKHDLREWLVLPGGGLATNLEPIVVEVAGLLPAKHDGALEAGAVPGLPRLGGYRAALMALGLAWGVGWAGWWMTRRREVESEPSETTTRAETLEERLRPLVESALRRELGLEGQARLERLLLGHWRHRLGWEGLPMDEALRRLRVHEEAGALVRSLEGWLHRPAGTVEVDVEVLLAPYREVVASMGEEGT